ncbi:MAG: cell division protein ZapA [Gammaproteobacteria bacterium]|nr:cell division protein ZapA [Gammaproteobacteria bacterium]MDE0093751.1 cell division protein ZapA [Gammaproteobacteria bacterium]MDE0252247.1 cell division protein ZapA [Gammaproteobacteria bacterium]MDE0402644.1 cell division protein ZapA [Gammaproteobacteria bacterium]MDE0646125.1 cell division protein ZapA [Gammaproteobacteria bacterium]
MTISETTTISFDVLGKTYTLSCSKEESDSLRRAVNKLNEYVESMNQHTQTQYVTPDRILVAVAVNVVDLYLKQELEISTVTERIGELTASIRELTNQDGENS